MTVLGEHKIIINEEDLINKETVLNVMCLLGEVVIQVPENVNVVNKAFSLLGSISVADRLEGRNFQKKLIINGTVLLGEVKVKVRK